MAHQKGSEKLPFHRLPDNVQPIHYDIHLVCDMQNFSYVGTQRVDVKVLEPTRTVIVNSVGLEIKTVSYKNNDTLLVAQKIDDFEAEEKIVINFEKDLEATLKGTLIFEFKGVISEKLNGFYRSKYISEGKTKYAAITQFAPTDARRCFPCWDEPKLKATFDVSLTIDKHLNASSNMEIRTEISSNSLKTISFHTTPVMSTYLVAIMISDYDFIESSVGNTSVRVHASKEKISQGEFALQVGTKSLQFFENYFNIPFPLKKIDLIALADFSFSAMENWGMITFREAVLLVDSQNSSTSKKQKAALTIAHEMAHQWFGNLVTMEWWTHLWLNEGYASFMENLCIDNLYPEYDVWAQFLNTKFIKALDLDALDNTHPIEVPVQNPSEITEIFDQISYNKGASIIRMIHNYIGTEDFRKGMTLYLNRYIYSNVETDDLWRALEETSKKPINRIMSTWTRLKGFPLVSVTEKLSNDSNTRIFSLTQERFLINGSIDKTNNTWMIPITFCSAENPEKVFKTIIFDEKHTDIAIEDVPEKIWVKINCGTIGFFRTLYSNDLMKLFIPAIRSNTIPAFDRLGLLDDFFATVVAGRASTVEYLKMLKEFKDETDYNVWLCILNHLKKIGHILSKVESLHQKFKSFGRELLSNVYSKLRWNSSYNENQLDTLLRISILSQLVSFEDKDIINEAKRRFDMHINKQNILPADFREFVYKAVLSDGGTDTFEKILTLFKETDNSEEKNRILASLGAVKDMNLLQRTLEFSMSKQVRAQDTVKAIHSVTMSYSGQLLAWQYFKNNVNSFIDCCQSGTLLTIIVDVVTSGIVSEEAMQEVKEFFEKTNVPGTKRTVEQSLETIRLNLDWLSRDTKAIEDFLNVQ
ncbi:puromycin-sensitive aminopeptidase [Trichogramma pretiosum]|uniref:puromycin-sensitive aminopeptidase n=1 Tax=Trichogramma pretiosum TaxID=7493 RepID=UPI0006C95666|nr:puromycin-sensitive aminopeptidase [Trichogramma pretiosum]XP_023318424.1 puromycin-sensitive aminopeptidase [Trichogramma pretiosum]